MGGETQVTFRAATPAVYAGERRLGPKEFPFARVYDLCARATARAAH